MPADRPPVEVAGPRRVLRRYSLSDALGLHEAIIDSLDHLRPWMPWVAPEPLELADREHLIADWLDRWDAGEEFHFGVFEANALIGGCGLHRRVGPDGLEIGYWTRSGGTGRGVATEAAGCLVQAAFSMPQVEFVEVHHDRANVASGRVPQHLGFTFIEERDDAPSAPAEVGAECVWRLNRRNWTGLAPWASEQ
ncbi:MAG: GNAT family N-acetyltransferase [Acidimicrobiales bacterium]|jgi:RimJ/RimL family protein N-acetyltransferase|nr:GNAT family N-acetyltransferase [Acidimicrobiales bacterium]